jgi:methyl-accepting chemotaxis protein
MAMEHQGRKRKSKETSRAAPAVLATQNTPAKGNESLQFVELLSALQAMRAGDFSVRISADYDGLAGKIADTFNDIVAANERMSRELDVNFQEVVHLVGTEEAEVSKLQ